MGAAFHQYRVGRFGFFFTFTSMAAIIHVSCLVFTEGIVHGTDAGPADVTDCSRVPEEPICYEGAELLRKIDEKCSPPPLHI